MRTGEMRMGIRPGHTRGPTLTRDCDRSGTAVGAAIVAIVTFVATSERKLSLNGFAVAAAAVLGFGTATTGGEESLLWYR